ncbi:hypothetical protein BN997_03180 [Oceanobacillus oncorhynchi]|uniref:Uncharacterized protein n=1 Tax=Oceanobacillus oncorhynchi TaxID=545501 RepID=A0A0A1MD46_9BACI|nr:hypothetical protein BN997_03180 [Oceanobacillus oncorhynchi]
MVLKTQLFLLKRCPLREVAFRGQRLSLLGRKPLPARSTCCFSRRSRQHPLPSKKKYVYLFSSYKEMTLILATFLTGRVIAVPEEIHGDSCGNAQGEDPAEKSELLFSRRLSSSPRKAECISGVAITHPMKPVGAAIFSFFIYFPIL